MQSQNLTITQPHILEISYSHNLTISQPHILTTSHPHNLTSSQPHILTTSHPHNLRSSQPQNLTTSKLYKLAVLPSRIRRLRRNGLDVGTWCKPDHGLGTLPFWSQNWPFSHGPCSHSRSSFSDLLFLVLGLSQNLTSCSPRIWWLTCQSLWLRQR
jgi:hypothetical protein